MPPLPQPLPPGERPVGQLVAEAIRLYGRKFWQSLALGVAPAGFVLGSIGLDGDLRVAFAVLAGPLLLSGAYAVACLLAAGRGRDRLLLAVAVGLPAFLPFALARVVVFPGIYLLAFAWFALVGLAVPVVLLERRQPFAAYGRAVELARADYVHALGSIAALAIVIVVSLFVLFFLLAGFGDQTLPIAAFLAIVVLAPLFFLGAALLYFDQEARVLRRR